ncbi:hypothetical protein R1sor_017494 [Riccia sorocarpa]|uniref:Vacuolar protein sorting-associated protein 28 homolog n=1 Tax=Riccia sorocarpa TaxID=122646 RepID=A0ABD3I9T0_9MARC
MMDFKIQSALLMRSFSRDLPFHVPVNSFTFSVEFCVRGNSMAAYPEVKEMKLWNDKREREMYDNFADLFAIIKTTEKLEKAYVRDVISAKEYEPGCAKLIAQFRTLKTTLRDTVPDVERFMEAYKMDCPAAANRLLVSGIPEHKSASSDSGTAVAVAECVQHYITAMDSLRLNMVAVDQVHPLLSDLVGSLSRVPLLTPDFEGKVKGREWIAVLNKMGAADELNEQQVRQLQFDLESSYNAFINSLPKSSG